MPFLLDTGPVEQAQPVTQGDRRNHQPDFIHQAEPEKTLAYYRPAHHPDISIPRREYLLHQSLEVARVELHAGPRRRQFSACHHDRWSIAVGPAEFPGVLVGARAQHVAVYRLEDLGAVVVGDALVVDVLGVHPRNTVVLRGDEAVKAGNYVQRYCRRHCPRHGFLPMIMTPRKRDASKDPQQEIPRVVPLSPVGGSQSSH